MKKLHPPISIIEEESVNPALSTENAELMEKLVDLIFYRQDHHLDLPS